MWSGPRSGGAFTVLSLNFDTLGTGICFGGEINTVRALAAGGATNASGSQVIYATTDGLGPNYLSTLPVGGNVWVTTNATAVSGVSSTFKNVTLNGPGGNSINPSEFPMSGIAIDTSDPSGNTAYVTVMGFTGGPGHVWQTTNAGASWSDFTGAGANALPDSPVNAVVVDPSTHIVYVGTDVGVFQSPTSAPAWTELGPASSSQQTGFLPNVAVSALAIFNSGGQKLLRASTYGRGVWQFDLIAAPDFQITVPVATLTAFAGTTPAFNGTVTAVNGFNNSVVLSCTAGSTSPPNPCTPNPASFTPATTGTAFSLTTGSGIGDYNFNVQATGSDSNNTTHLAALTLHVVNFGLTAPAPATVTEPRGATSPPVSFQVTAQGSFNQSVTVSCSFSPSISGASCGFSPGTVVNPTSTTPVNMTATVTVPVGTATGNYTVTLQATTSGAPAPLTTSFTLAVTTNPSYMINGPMTLSSTPAGQVAANLTISSVDSYAGQVNATCDATALPGAQCTLTPANPITINAASSVPVTATINVPNDTTPGIYNININSQDVMGTPTAVWTIALTVFQDFTLGALTPSATQTITAGQSVSYNFTVLPVGSSFTNAVNLSCSGAPAVSLCSFTPNPVPSVNSSGGVAVVLKISTTASSASSSPHPPALAFLSYAFWLALPGLVLLGSRARCGKHAKLTLPASLLGLSLLALLLASCGGGGTNGGGGGGGSQQQGTKPGTYTITVTGASGTLSHTAPSTVTLVVN